MPLEFAPSIVLAFYFILLISIFQSIDRICRLGNNNEKNIYILQTKTPSSIKNIDLTVNLPIGVHLSPSLFL